MKHFIGPIEHNIPIPSDERRIRSPIMLVLSSLHPGDSFVTSVPYDHIHTYAARLDIIVATKFHEPGKIRVWKVK